MVARLGSFAKAFDRNGQIWWFVARLLTNRGTFGLYTELSPVARAWADDASHQIWPCKPPNQCTLHRLIRVDGPNSTEISRQREPAMRSIDQRQKKESLCRLLPFLAPVLLYPTYEDLP